MRQPNVFLKNVRDLKVGDRVYWTDPDRGLASGPATVAAINGDPGERDDETIIALALDSGSEAEVCAPELRMLR